MKQLIVLICVFFAFQITVNAQEVLEEARMMSMGSQNALTVQLKSNDTKMIEKEWEKHLKSYKGKTKKNKKTGEIFTDNAKMRSLSANDVDVYARCVESGNNVEFAVWFDLGGAYLNSEDHASAFEQATAMIGQFEVQVHQIMVQRELDDQEKMLKGFEKDLAKLQKDKEGYEKDIENYKQKIAEREMDIEQNLVDQQNKESEIESQRQIVAEVAARLGAIQ